MAAPGSEPMVGPNVDPLMYNLTRGVLQAQSQLRAELGSSSPRMGDILDAASLQSREASRASAGAGGTAGAHESVVRVKWHFQEEFLKLREALIADFRTVLRDVQAQHGQLLERQEAVVERLLVAAHREPAIYAPPFALAPEGTTYTVDALTGGAANAPDPLVSANAPAEVSPALPIGGFRQQLEQSMPEAHGRRLPKPKKVFSQQLGKGLHHSESAVQELADENRLLAHQHVDLQAKPIISEDTAGHEATELTSQKSTGAIKKESLKVVAELRGAFQGIGSRSEKKLDEEEYTVESKYWETGVVARVARSDLFANVTLGVIVVNAVYMGYDADRNTADDLLSSDWGYVVMEMIFCTFFTGELLLRFCAFARKLDAFRDGWFRFDSTLVLLMVGETWVLPAVLLITKAHVQHLPTGPLRVLRLLRLSRLVRLMRQLPELVTMLKGMYVASRAVISSLLLVIIMIYVASIILHMMLKEEMGAQYHFGTLPLTMWTLFMDGTLLDNPGEMLRNLLDLGTWSSILAWCIILLFILMSALTVMNMLVGVLCEVVSAVAAQERDDAAITLVKKSILVELKKYDADQNGTINRKELMAVMRSDETLAVLQGLEIDVGCLEELQQMLFPLEDSEATIDMIMSLLLDYRGAQSTTVKHLVDGLAYTRHFLSEKLRKQDKKLETYMQDLGEFLEAAVGDQGLGSPTSSPLAQATPWTAEAEADSVWLAEQEEPHGVINGHGDSPSSAFQGV